MADFAAASSYSQGVNGTPVVFTDASNYTSNTENYTTADFTRSFLIYNASMTLLDTLPMTGSNLTASYTVSADQYLIAVLQLIGIGSVPDFTATVDAGLVRYYNNNFNKVLKFGSCQLGKQAFDKLTEGVIFKYGADTAYLYAQGVAYDNYITAANAYITS